MIIEIKPDYPSPYRIKHCIDALEKGLLIAIPTDTNYALACLPQKRSAVAQMIRLRRLDPKKPRALIFASIQQISMYTMLDDVNFRILKRFLPGPYCFILESNRKLPRFIGDKRQHIGVRIPKHPVVQAILNELDTPLTVTSAIDPDSNLTLCDPWSVEASFGHGLALVIDGGDVYGAESSLIDLTDGKAEVLRHGLGDIKAFSQS